MKVILLNLPNARIRFTTVGTLPPLGLGYIASHLEKNGHSVKIIDLAVLNINETSFKRLIYDEEPCLVGITSSIFLIRKALYYVNIIKEVGPKITVVLGGYCTTFSPEVILKKAPQVDIIVKDEGEYTMLELCEHLEHKKPLAEIKGIFYRNAGQIMQTAPGRWIEDLDSNLFPARHLFLNNSYRLHPPFGMGHPVTSLETSRGCTSSCIFCLYPGYRPYRFRSAKNVADEIELVSKKYGAKEIYFVDSTLTIDPQRTVEICEEIIRRKLKISWTCKARIDTVSSSVLKAMKESGCYMISFGVESGCQEILNNLKKNIKLSQIETAIKMTKEAKIRSIAYLLVGSPGETPDSIKQTISLINRIEPDFAQYSGLMVSPSSQLYARCVEEKILPEKWYEDAIFSEKEGSWPFYTTSNFTEIDVVKWTEEGYKKFYFRLRFLFKRIKDLRNMSDFKNMCRGLGFLVSDMFFRIRRII